MARRPPDDDAESAAARTGEPGSHITQFTPDAVSVVRSSDAFGPTTTWLSAGFSAIT
jgi:hypothetical protein